ncbi:L,D-transpeptidase family protein [Conexibacter sp. SYSU D00693]|uniref:L,D-transpeptidase family protein n=1 Tax=Conexibacter sp. SYSU D00693 TaxID=2812560 RepID=UPI00196B304C|nr:L,D-transpeptidase family protein [Conexibacter sp. SYSU D00693]
MLRRVAVASLGLALVPAATATAQDPAAQDPAAAPKLALSAEKVNGARSTVLAGTRFRVRGVLTPYVAGQTATVRFYRGDQRISRRQVTLLPSASGKSAYFVLGFATKQAGRLRIEATKDPSTALGAVKAAPRRVTVLALRARPGQRGAAVRELQRMLRSKGYVIGKPGVYDGRTGRAVLAFRKVVGLQRSTLATADVFRRLARGQGTWKVRYPSHGRHVEADISRQVLALIGEGGKVERIYHTSSGAPATPTIRGQFKVYRKDLGTNAKGMVHSSYFIRGYAIHGYVSVPNYNASHGCLRVPVPDAMSIFRWVRMGTRVDVYD